LNQSCILISRDALRANLQLARRIAGGCEVIAVVKSNGYGIGALPLAQVLSVEGVCHWAVGTVEEGIALRSAGISGEIIILGHLESDDRSLRLATANDCSCSINCPDDAHRVLRWCRASCRSLKVHLQFEIGMARLGLQHDVCTESLNALCSEDLIKIAGIYGHPASGLATGLREEHARFLHTLQSAPEPLQSIPSHFANSAALVAGIGLRRHQFVRLGIALLGGSDNIFGDETEDPAGRSLNRWSDVVTIRTQIVQLQMLERGATVSYGGTFRADRRTIIGVVPLGYADGLPTSLSNRLIATVRGCPIKQVGQITMNYFMVDVTDIQGVAVGDSVTIGAAPQNFRELSRISGHLPHELYSRLSPRVARVVV
jgi:alanine racemase